MVKKQFLWLFILIHYWETQVENPFLNFYQKNVANRGFYVIFLHMLDKFWIKTEREMLSKPYVLKYIFNSRHIIYINI